MNEIITDDRKSHLNLQKMAEAAKINAIAFRSLTEPLLAGQYLLRILGSHQKIFHYIVLLA